MTASASHPVKLCVLGLRGMPNVLGGVESHCEHLYPELAKSSNIEITVFTRRAHGEKGEALFKGVRIVPVISPRIFGVDALLHSLFALLYMMLRIRPHIVHIHGIGPAFFTPLARIMGAKTVVTHHAQDYLRPKWDWKGRMFLKWGERLAARFAHRVICVSNSLKDDFLHKYPGAAHKTQAIFNAPADFSFQKVDTSTLLGSLGLRPREYILAAGRLEETKNYLMLLEAFRNAAPPGLKLLIAGTSIDKQSGYETKLRNLASADVIFSGYQLPSALHHLYENACLFVHPSRMEGYSLVVAEALAAGLPVLLSDIPVHREFQLPDGCFFRVDDGARLTRLLTGGDYERFLDHNAIERQRANGWARAAREHEKLYLGLRPSRPVAAPAMER